MTINTTATQAMMVRPLAVTTTRLTSTTVPEAAPAAYDGGTTYASGDRAHTGTTGGPLTVWQSLQASNTGNTPASSPLWWVEVAITYSTYSGAATYALGDVVIDTTAHLEYESLADGNIGNALSDTTKWLLRGATNAWAQFDESPESRTVQTGAIVQTFTLGEIVDALVLINLQGATAQLTEPVSGYNETVTLIYRSVVGWLTYWTEPFYYRTEALFQNLPPNPAAVFTLTITPVAGAQAAVGCTIFGRTKRIGNAQYGTSVGIIDYSVKSTDAFGRTTVVERGYSKRMSMPVWLSAGAAATPGLTDDLLATFADYRASPVVWIASSLYQSTIVYGYYRDFGLVLAGPSYSTYDLSIEGLV